MEIAKTYNPGEAESKWYPHWMQQNFFSSTPDSRTPYTIVIPPPNVTGMLHMGHMLNNTIQDVLIRRARMLGMNACWVPGTDHASIATETKVVNLLAEKGIKKTNLSREDFLKHAWDWKEKYGGIILEQLKKLGASCDWDRTRFTMDPAMSEAVLDAFVSLHNKGQIYRGVRMVNWDPQGLTALSDEEVIHKETNSKLVYVKYKVEASDEFITVATTRPETIMGDTAVCVNPNDERYSHLKGKNIIVPVVNRVVPIIFDDYVDASFGTGALKVTPAHDINDFNLGQKYKLPTIDALTPDGKISEAAGVYVGMDRFACRKQIVKDLQEQGLVEKVEDIKNKVGYSERTNAVIEPKLSLQWFLKMDEISKPALDAVMSGEVKLIPEKYINTYKHWMENVHDWCISRQLWWGQRIPAWYDGKGNTVVCKTREEAFEKLKIKNEKLTNDEIKQDEDVLDTWFSSWLWPLTVFDPNVIKNGWENANEELKYYYPTNDLVTGPDILFFWIARMIIAGKEFTGLKPFTNVYLTGIVRDNLGRKMSKQLGNSPDPLDLVAKYGADGVRVGMLLSSPAGNDLLFDEKDCEQGRNFANKVWNAFRLIKGFEVGASAKQSAAQKAAITWFENKLSEQLEFINDHYSKYRMSDALMTTYKLVWDDFCAWYLEIIKPEFVDGKSLPIDKTTYDATIIFLEQLLKVMHPWMPFVTEEIWHLITERSEKECVIVAEWPKQLASLDARVLGEFEVCKELVTTARNVRAQKQIPPKEKLEVIEKSSSDHSYFNEVVIKLANLSAFKYSKEKVDGAYSFTIQTTEFFIPLANNINVEEEKERLKKELEYNKGFLKSVQIKLSNEKFVANAKPEIIAVERKKESDALSKIDSIEEQLKSL
ncbi:valine--tRNA ligase [Aurantibacillus circumpalustris]|uniref:valine--tRNA ligase n=1 Tax=Aurantibacillus circumpalustris TaxID=3036359 RepID=UPI00295C1565|nr:valine--tRNA ligase [Aurantibacillus circumpalustris]